MLLTLFLEARGDLEVKPPHLHANLNNNYYLYKLELLPETSNAPTLPAPMRCGCSFCSVKFSYAASARFLMADVIGPAFASATDIPARGRTNCQGWWDEHAIGLVSSDT